MNEFELFQAALDLNDPAARKSFLTSSCGDDRELLHRVQALLASHEGQSQFLNTPVVEQIAEVPDTDAAATMMIGNASTHDDDPAATMDVPPGAAAMSPHQDDSDDEIPLGYLEPSTKPGALGRLAHYEILEVIGRGAFGTVLRAFDEKLQRVVAIKVMSPEMASTSPARKRFIREAQASGGIRHENVVSVHAVEEKPIPYLVMDYIPGINLQQRLDERGPLDVLTVLRLGRQIAEGLAAAHAQDLIHRDVKPANILLESGAREMVKVTDFGLARAADDASLTQSGTIAGTPMYMAPEQALGHKLDHRADLFSFGSVLYQMTSGRPPFRAATTLAVLKRLNEDTPRPIREIIPETPQWLCDIISKLHAKNPDERYQTAREVADVLAHCEFQLKAHASLKDFSLIPPPTHPQAQPQTDARWKWVAVVAILIPLLAFGVYSLTRPPARDNSAANGTINSPGTELAKSDGAPSSVSVAKEAPKAIGGTPLFNGKDLTGWQAYPAATASAWRVNGDELVGGGKVSYLFYQPEEYENLRLHVEFQVNKTGNGGVYLRSPLPKSGDGPHPKGYEAQIIGPDARASNFKTGSLINFPTVGAVIDADTWYTMDILADGGRLVVRLNGVVTSDVQDDKRQFSRGHIALQVWDPGTSVRFRKIEIEKLLASVPAGAPPSSSIALRNADHAKAHQEVGEKQLNAPAEYTNSIGMEFVKVPKGKSWLGGSKTRLGEKEIEIPADYYMAKYEVTQEEWQNVVGYNPSYFSRTGVGIDAVKDISDDDLKRFPVDSVTWDDCQLLITKLNKSEAESGWVYRLPKEVEWEYACRGGPMAEKVSSAFDFYLAQPTNTLVPAEANFNNGTPDNYSGLSRTSKVGSYAPNALGLHDMHGNLWEWCDDADTTYEGEPGFANRGGSWGSPTEESNATFRAIRIRTNMSQSHGVRLVRVPAGTPSTKD